MFDVLSNWPALGAAGEQAWQALRQHTEWTEGFWLAWLFTGYPPMVHELETRMEGFLHERAQRQVVLRPGTPEEARNLLEDILAEDTRTAHCVWVEIIHGDGLGLAGEDSPGPWTEAWDWLMMRANERRTALSKHLPGGLVFVGAPMFKDRARRAAPDLWSIRALVLEPAPPELHWMPGLLDAVVELPELERPDDAPDVELALEHAARMSTQGHRSDECKALMRAARGLLARGETAEALRRASEAVDAAGEDRALQGRALALLGEVEMKHGDPVAAERHLSTGLALLPEQNDSRVFKWMTAYVTLLIRRGAWADAERGCMALAVNARDRLQREPQNLQVQLALAAALNLAGQLRFREKRLDEAAEAFAEALRLSNVSLPPGADSKMSFRIADMSAEALGTVNWALRHWEQAEQSFRTALSLAERWYSDAKMMSEAGQAIITARCKALFLLGVALLKRGSWEEGERMFQEALRVARATANGGVDRLTQGQLVHLHLYLALLAAARESQTEALEHAAQSLELGRSWYQASEGSPTTLATFRFVIETLVYLRRATGDEAGARAAEAELAALPQPGSDS